MPEIVKCHQCGASVFIIKTSMQNWICIEATPSPAGIVVIHEGVAFVSRGELFERLPEGPRYCYHDCKVAKK